MIQFVKRQTKPASPGQCRIQWVDRLEFKMREMAHAGENVTPETLMQHGFNAAVIERYGEAAVNMARRRSIKVIGHVDA
jgi:hypothetical protein